MLVIDDLSVRIAGRLLIERSSVRIPEGARLALRVVCAVFDEYLAKQTTERRHAAAV